MHGQSDNQSGDVANPVYGEEQTQSQNSIEQEKTDYLYVDVPSNIYEDPDVTKTETLSPGKPPTQPSCGNEGNMYNLPNESQSKVYCFSDMKINPLNIQL